MSRIVRVFISSTCTDMDVERNRLVKCIYPKLKAYCRERYGIEFQVVDMRWGLPPHSCKYETTEELCLEEIRKCVHSSLGPNFVLFLGQRYGSYSLPATLPMAEYEVIRNALQTDGVDVTHLDSWYLKDSNHQPPVYVLQSIDHMQEEDTSYLKDAYTILSKQLIQGATACVSNRLLRPEVLNKLKSSVVGLELIEALKAMPTARARERNFLSYNRTIKELESKLDCDKASAYCDLLPGTQRMDSVAFEELNHLRQKLHHILSSENFFEGVVPWIDPLGIDPLRHEEYLEYMGNDFFAKMRNLIDMNVVLGQDGKKDDMYNDVIHHWTLARDMCDKFVGRDDVLKRVRDYFLNITEEPLILYGAGGHGKTFLLAKTASFFPQWLCADGRNIQTMTLLRFCGTSPMSSHIRLLLPSLCHQMAYTTDKFRHKVPLNYKGVKRYFNDFITYGEFRGLLVIILDAVNQLSEDDGAHKLDWLPAKIAKNVKIVISTSPQSILTQLKTKVTNVKRYIEVDPLHTKDCYDIMTTWIRKEGKCLQYRQWQLVRDTFKKCTLPLFIQLTFNKVIHWHSYEEVDTLSLKHCVEDCINELFDQLESKYGKVIVAHLLAYLTASGGLSEVEIDDILSLDDIALNSVFGCSFPSIRRNPPNIWQRMRHDINSYLVERDDSELRILFWYHQQFVEAVTSRYLSDPKMHKHIHDTIVDYLLGTWSGQRLKPYQCEVQKDDSRKELVVGEAVRYVPEQPLVYTTFTTSKRYNLRKLNHLPYQLAMAGRWEELRTKVYFSYEWIFTKLLACSVQNVIADYYLDDHMETTLVGDALRMSESALTVDPKVLSLELSGRLLPHMPKCEHIRSLIHQCDIAAVSGCGIVPSWQTFTCPGGPLQYVCETEINFANEPVSVTTIESAGRLLLTAKLANSTKLRIWDITQGEPRLDLLLLPGMPIYPTPNGQFINMFSKNKSLQVFHLESGEKCADVPYGCGEVQQMAVSNKYAAFTLKQAVGPCVIDIEACSLIHRFHYQSDRVTLSADNRYLLCNSGQLIAFHALPLMERMCLIQVYDLPQKLVFHKNDPKHFFVLFKNNELCAYKMDLNHKTSKAIKVLHDLDLKDFKLNHKNTLLLVRALRCLFVFTVDNTYKYILKYRLIKMPTGVFHENLSTFCEASFTSDDTLLVAGRHTYLAVWRACSGEPLRLLQMAVCPIINLFTTSIDNKVITVLEDNTIQVWNLDNLYEDINHCKLLVKGGVKSISVALQKHLVIACGSECAEARILDLKTGHTEWNIVHTEEAHKTIREVHMSPLGNFAVTQLRNTDLEDCQQPWELLTEDKLWKVDAGTLAFELTRCRCIVFSEDDKLVVFVSCRHYNLYDFTMNWYEVVVVFTTTWKVKHIELPAGELVGKPVVVDLGSTLAVLIQVYTTQADGKRIAHIQLLLYSLDSLWHDLKAVTLSDLWSGVALDDTFLNINSLNGDHLLVIYMRGVTLLQHTSSGALNYAINVSKGALMYNLRNNQLIRHLDTFLSENSNVSLLLSSHNLSVIMDNHMRIYDVILNRCIHHLTVLEKVLNSSAKLFLNGTYMVVISQNLHEILIYRCKDSVRKSRFFVHGEACQLSVGADDRTIVVGCSDGRCMVFTALFEHLDPVGDLIDCLQSRQIVTEFENVLSDAKNQTENYDYPLRVDIKNIRLSDVQLRQMSIAKQEKHEADRRRPPSFKAVSAGVLIMQNHQKVAPSSACAVQ